MVDPLFLLSVCLCQEAFFSFLHFLSHVFDFFFLFYLKKLFNISRNTGLVVMTSFSILLSGKLFISSLILNDSLAAYITLDSKTVFYHLDYFVTFASGMQSFCFCFFEKLANSPKGDSWYVSNGFSLAAFKILSLCLIFGILITTCLDVGPLGSSCVGIAVLPGLVCLCPLLG